MSKVLFLSDEPIEDISQDAFGHGSIVETLYRCVEACVPKMNIGLYGGWGVGKTSVVNLLLGKFQSQRPQVKTFFFDAWKYSQGALRQEFVLSLNRQYNIIKPQEKLERRIYAISEEEEPIAQAGLKDALANIWSKLWLSITVAVGIFILLVILDAATPIEAQSYMPVVVLPVLAQIGAGLISAAGAVSRRHMLPAKFDPERLEKAFKDIVDGIVKDRRGKLVIVIDNLDRCCSEDAIEMLESIKTFMGHERCVYIIPCDASALTKHLVSVRKYEERDAQEFLRKIFQTSFIVPPLLAQSLADFARNELAKLEIEYSQEVLYVIVSAFMENPRRIKQFINNLTAQYLAAEERERAGTLGPGEVTSKHGFLAKILVIRQEYPSFYTMLEADEHLLDTVETHLRKGGEPPSHDGRSIFDCYPGLKSFLVGTRTITVKDLSPFLKLNKETYPSAIADAEAFRLEVNNGNVDYIRENLVRLELEEHKVAYMRQIVNTIDHEGRAANYNWVFNGVDILTKIYEEAPAQERRRIADAVGHYLSLAEMKPYLGQFNCERVFTLIQDVSEVYQRDIVDKYSELLVPEHIDEELVDQFMKHSDIVPETAIDNINNVLTFAWENNRNGVEPVLLRFSQQHEARERIVRGKLTAKIEETIATTIDDENRQVVALYLTLKDRSDESTRLSFLNKVLSILATNMNASYDETKRFGLDTLGALDLDDVPDEGVNELYRILDELARLMPPSDDRLEFVAVFFHFLALFTESKEQEFLHNNVVPLIDLAAVDVLLKTLEMAAGHGVELLAYDFMLDEFAKRVLKDLPEVPLMEALTQNTPKAQRWKVKDMIIQLVNRNEPQFYNAGLESFGLVYQKFTGQQVGEICEACLDRSTNTAMPEKPKFIEMILNPFPKCPAAFKSKFSDHVSKFITDDNIEIRNMGIQCFEQIKEHLSQERKKAVVVQVLRAIDQKVAQDAIDERSEPLLDLVIAQQSLLGETDTVRLVDMLLDLRSTVKPREIRLIGLKFLGRVDRLYDRREMVLSTLKEDSGADDKEVSELATALLDSIHKSQK